MKRTLFTLACASSLLLACNRSEPPATATPAATNAAKQCETLAKDMVKQWPDATTNLTQVLWHPAAKTFTPQHIPIPVVLPAHCEVYGQMQAYQGVDGQDYAIKFRIRLPEAWNGRFLFQGGAGSNGNIGDATGFVAFGKPTAIEQGFAVVTQDSGHDNNTNTLADKNGELAFGLDPTARSNYGGASLKPVADAAKAVITHFYGKQPDYAYFSGCSKGGQEGMMFAQRHSDVFDGIIASAPGFALPKAALAQIWDLRAFSRTETGDIKVTADRLRQSFSDAQLGTVQSAILTVCDAADGIQDGMTMNYAACKEEQVIAELQKQRCKQDNNAAEACLSTHQISILEQVMQGAKGRDGEDLYAAWAWDAGIGSQDWRIWKIGLADGSVPSINFSLGAKAVAGVFTTPPSIIGALPAASQSFVEQFDFAEDAAKIYAVTPPYTYSAWQDIGAKSTDLTAFKARGAKMIVPHGVADPVFSVLDTIDWYNAVNEKNQGKASDFVRVFPVPGMAHCAGGPTVESFDALSALIAWVEQGKAPDRIPAVATDRSPWPGRERPLCPYPQYARYLGAGDIEKSESFECVTPGNLDNAS